MSKGGKATSRARKAFVAKDLSAGSSAKRVKGGAPSATGEPTAEDRPATSPAARGRRGGAGLVYG